MSRPDPIEAALAAPTRAALRDALRPRPLLARPDLARLSARLRALDEPRAPLRLALVRTYATELLEPWWSLEALLFGFDLALYTGAYGALRQEAAPGGALERHAPEVLYVLGRLEDWHPRWRQPRSLLAADERRALVAETVEALAADLAALRAVVPGLVVVALLPEQGPPELGFQDARVPDSQAALRAELKAALAARLAADLAGVLLHDLDRLGEELGRRGLFDARLWHSSRFPFSSHGAQRVVRELATYALARRAPPAKVVVVDADNVLWGGVVGEEGPAGIALGPEYPGSLFVAFQERLLALRRRGLLLALCSKNEEADVLEVLREHPHQVLREEHFAARRVNWEAKPENLRGLAQELNLGLESFVFVDDSPHECHAVRLALPAVDVVQAPADPLLLPGCLDEEPRLEVLALTDEDRARSAMVEAERRRVERRAGARDLDEYLRSLAMVMRVRFDDRVHLARIAQLTQKTNQFNLTTRRYGEEQVRAFMDGERSFVASFSLADVFGDSGLVGVAIVTPDGSDALAVDTFLMSCRVIGRGAETAFLRSVLEACRARGARRVLARYEPTPKNAQVAGFWEQCGFRALGEGRFALELAGPLALARPPIEVRTEG